LPSAWSLKPIWQLSTPTLAIYGLSALAYIAVIASVRYGEQRGRPTTALQVAFVTAAAYLAVSLAAFVFHPRFSRFALLASPLLALTLAWLALSVHGKIRVRLTAAILLAVIAIAVQASIVQGFLRRPGPQPTMADLRVGTSLYELAITSFRSWIPQPNTQQGGITTFGTRYLLSTGDGDLYTFDRPPPGHPLEMQKLPRRVPMNAADFAASMREMPIELRWFRVADILVRQTASGVEVYASHHFWKADQACFVLRISAFEGREVDFIGNAGDASWKTLYESTPCLPVVERGNSPRFGGLLNGGRMAFLSDRELLLSIGDHAMDGWGIDHQAGQDPGVSYGKIILIDLNNRSSRLFSLGHRNPQGLFVGTSGLIWSTEHGPQGGDELNLIREGANYGWPVATYGVENGTHAWPLTAAPGSHDGFAQPYFSWVPSIGVSNLLEVRGSLFKRWRGDLIVSSLTARKLWRLRIRDDRVVLAEQMPVGERVRDIIEGHRGELVLWTDREGIMFVEPSAHDSVSAQALYMVCAGCHVPAKGEEHGIAPSLHGILGRHIAADQDFEYSPPMMSMRGVWTKERLDAFLLNPHAVVPGTSMQFAGIADSSSRQQLIEFLAADDEQLDVSPPPGHL
jgi:cytochrome c2